MFIESVKMSFIKARFNKCIQNMCIPQLPPICNEKKRACILYEIRGAELCAVQKATGLSGEQNKRQNWAIVSICCLRERER